MKSKDIQLQTEIPCEALPHRVSVRKQIVMSEPNIKRSLWNVCRKHLQKAPFKTFGGVLALVGLVYLISRKADTHFEISVEKLKIEVNGTPAKATPTVTSSTNSITKVGP